MSQPNFAAIEAGRRSPRPVTLERLLAAAQIRPSVALDRHRAAVRRLVAARRGHDPRVFGSVARGTDRPGSDVDLLVTMERGASAWDLTGLELDLEELLGVHVDVVPDDGISRTLQRARAEAVPL